MIECYWFLRVVSKSDSPKIFAQLYPFVDLKVRLEPKVDMLLGFKCIFVQSWSQWLPF